MLCTLVRSSNSIIRNDLFKNPAHPYTRALLSAIPVFDVKENRAKKRIILEGEIPNPLSPPKGCVFSTRCSYKKDICEQEVPELIEFNKGHYVACHRVKEIN